MRRASFVPSEPASEPRWIVTTIGPAAAWLRDRWMLAAIIFFGAGVAAVVPRVALDSAGKPDAAFNPLVIGSGLIAAIAIFLDRIADAADKWSAARKAADGSSAAEAIFLTSEASAEKTARDLVTFLGATLKVPLAAGAARDQAIRSLADILTICAASVIGDEQGRATYYTLSVDAEGFRTLGEPVHHLGYQRDDQPDRPFVEKETPEHTIWNVLDAPDMEAEVHSQGDVVYGVEWEKKAYRTFISVPVRTADHVFGLLSVNSSELGSIGGAQRATIIAMARIMAAVLVMDLPASIST